MVILRRLIITSCPTTHHVTYIFTVFEVLLTLYGITLGVVLDGRLHDCGGCLMILHGRGLMILHGRGGFLIFLGINKIRTCRTGYIKYII